MKNTLLVIVVLLVGCGKITGYDLNQPMSEERIKQRKQKKKAAEDNNTKPIKVADTNATKLTAEEQKVVGEYEIKRVGFTSKFVLLENGVYEWYVNGKKEEEEEWSVVKGEIHTVYEFGTIGIYKINEDKSITQIATIRNGKREEHPKDDQNIYKKIK